MTARPAPPLVALIEVGAARYADGDADACRAIRTWATGPDDHDPGHRCGLDPLDLYLGINGQRVRLEPGDWLVRVAGRWLALTGDEFAAVAAAATRTVTGV